MHVLYVYCIQGVRVWTRVHVYVDMYMYHMHAHQVPVHVHSHSQPIVERSCILSLLLVHMSVSTSSYYEYWIVSWHISQWIDHESRMCTFCVYSSELVFLIGLSIDSRVEGFIHLWPNRHENCGLLKSCTSPFGTSDFESASNPPCAG